MAGAHLGVTELVLLWLQMVIFLPDARLVSKSKLLLFKEPVVLYQGSTL